MNMNNEKLHAIMMKIVDGVATPEDEQAFASAASEDPAWETELRAFRSIKEVTDQMQYKEMPDSYWESYWENMLMKLWLTTTLHYKPSNPKYHLLSIKCNNR